MIHMLGDLLPSMNMFQTLYIKDSACALCGMVVTLFFSINNGVKQGGILSPIMFCDYIDELLYCLIESKCGCRIGHISYSVIGYANDVGLQTLSIQALQALLRICVTFS